MVLGGLDLLTAGASAAAADTRALCTAPGVFFHRSSPCAPLGQLRRFALCVFRV